MNYSTTYIAQIAQFISLGLLLFNIHINAPDLTIALNVAVQIVSGLYVFYGRYKAGHVSVTGFRTE